MNILVIDPALPPQQLLRTGVEGHGLLSVERIREVVSAAQLLYDGSLADLAQDIQRRLDGRPYLFVSPLAKATTKSANGSDVSEMLSITECLHNYECQSGVFLAQVLQEESQ